MTSAEKRPSRYDPPLTVLLTVAGLVGVSLFIRLLGTDWDGWASLHPDERHMIFILRAMQDGLAEAQGQNLFRLWFGPESPIDPRIDGAMVVYGDLPLLTGFLASQAQDVTDWGGLLQTGRVATAIMDAATVLACFVLAYSLVGQPWPAVGAAAIYALAPMPLQLANFYTVDPWLTTFSSWALIALIAVTRARRPAFAAASAGFLCGLALACKITGIALVLPTLLALVIVAGSLGVRRAILSGIAGLGAAFFAFRMAHPFAFAGPNPMDGLSDRFIDSYRALAAFSANPDAPPNWQWIAGYPVEAALRDVVLFGTGPALSVLLLGLIWRRPRTQAHAGPLVILVAALVGNFLILAPSELLPLRYLAPVLPVFAALAAPVLACLPIAASAIPLALAIWWGAGVVRLHDGAHPRLEASAWMRTIPADTIVASETIWDESLPVYRHKPDGSVLPSAGPFQSVVLDLTAPHGPEKAELLAQQLAKAEFLVASSGRQREIMPRLPDRFPVVTRYYAALKNGQLCFDEVFHLDRGFPLPFLKLNDQFAQEPWRVYDHPIVTIWSKAPCFDEAVARAVLEGRQ